MEVLVPAGAAPGSAIQVQTPDGQVVNVTVPDGCAEGDKIEVSYVPTAQAVAYADGYAPPPGGDSGCCATYCVIS